MPDLEPHHDPSAAAGAARRSSRRPADRLALRRPRPERVFREQLRERLLDELTRSSRPKHLRLLVLAYLGSGLLLLVLALALASGARAAQCAPPGVSGVSQYLETIPGAKCPQPTGGSGKHHRGGALPPGTARGLAAQGPAGASVAQLVAASGTAPARRGAGRRGGAGSARGRRRQSASGGGGEGGAAPPAVSGRSPATAIIHPLVSSGGGVSLLAIVLGAIALLIAVAAILRWRLSR